MDSPDAATPPANQPVTSAPAAPGTATPVAEESEKGIAAVAYILTWLTGIIILLVAKKEQRYARWNAVQAIAFGIVVTAVAILLNILTTVGAMGGVGGFGLVALLGLLGLLFWLGTIVLVVLLAVKAYQGTPLRLPVLAGYADKYA